jgi:hypothetical protein
MGLIEILFEKRNPGSIGSVQKNNQPIRHVGMPLLILKLLVSLAIISGLFYFTVWNSMSIKSIIAFIVILLVYCVIGYNVIPKPDTSNVGLLGGLFDHPFRYSDDLNRMLIMLFIVLYPGRFISTTAVQIMRLFKKAYYF